METVLGCWKDENQNKDSVSFLSFVYLCIHRMIQGMSQPMSRVHALRAHDRRIRDSFYFQSQRLNILWCPLINASKKTERRVSTAS